MAKSYEKTEWVNDQTPVNAKNMNNIEEGIAGAHNEIADLKVKDEALTAALESEALARESKDAELDEAIADLKAKDEALTAATVSNCLGYYMYDADVAARTITLSAVRRYNADGTENEQVLPNAELLARWGDPAVFDAYEIQHQYVSYDAGVFYTLVSKVTAVDTSTGVITLDEIPFTQEVFDTKIKTDVEGTGFTIYAPLTPEAGEIAVTGFAFAQGIESKAIGNAAVAINAETAALGPYSFAAGRKTTAGYGAAAFGFESVAFADHSFVSGTNCNVEVSGTNGHAEGHGSTVQGVAAHAEGHSTQAAGNYSHAEGDRSKALTKIAHAEGEATEASGIGSHTEGKETKATAQAAHAEGIGTKATGLAQHVQGKYNVADTTSAHIVGNGTADAPSNAHTLDWDGNAWFAGAVFIGENKDKLATEADVQQALENGIIVAGTGDGSAIMNNGSGNAATVKYAYAEGQGTAATGTASHAEGCGTAATHAYAHAEGYGTLAEGNRSHAEGTETQALSQDSHAEGYRSVASGNRAHAEGFQSQALGAYSHVEGVNCKSVEGSNYVHAEGQGTIGSGLAQHVQGRFNIQDASYAHIVGNGTSDTARSNAHTVDWAGNAWFAGSVTFNGNCKISTVHTLEITFEDGSSKTLRLAGAE
ncbi:MAG: hypothetical protein IJZ15_04320 [Oscillospiraceae bacterium]|nr:hypothetical protein [Oscillospiraceae bacterium]